MSLKLLAHGTARQLTKYAAPTPLHMSDPLCVWLSGASLRSTPGTSRRLDSQGSNHTARWLDPPGRADAGLRVFHAHAPLTTGVCHARR